MDLTAVADIPLVAARNIAVADHHGVSARGADEGRRLRLGGRLRLDRDLEGLLARRLKQRCRGRVDIPVQGERLDEPLIPSSAEYHRNYRLAQAETKKARVREALKSVLATEANVRAIQDSIALENTQ